jgi:hypothetical protein
MNSGRGLRNTPLKGLLAWILLVLFVPALGCGLTSQMIETTTERQIVKIQTKIQEVDETINGGEVTIGLTNTSPCPERKYFDQADQLIAQDTYILMEDTNQCQLSIRSYYENGVIQAKDFIGLADDEGIEKHREYFNTNGVVFLKEDFIRGGHPLQKWYLIGNIYVTRQNSMESPLPPPSMLYVYFYR